MSGTERIERALQAAIAAAEGPSCPPRLAEALRYSVFPGGARVRPKLCLAVALACGDDRPRARRCGGGQHRDPALRFPRP